MSTLQTLRSHRVFEALGDEQVDRIASFSSAKSFAAGAIIYRPDDRATHVYLVTRGLVHLTLPAMSKDFGLRVSEVEPGELCGIAGILGGTNYTAIARAVEPTEVVAIDAQRLSELLEANPAAGIRIIRDVARLYMERYTDVMTNLQAMVSHIPLTR